MAILVIELQKATRVSHTNPFPLPFTPFPPLDVIDNDSPTPSSAHNPLHELFISPSPSTLIQLHQTPRTRQVLNSFAVSTSEEYELALPIDDEEVLQESNKPPSLVRSLATFLNHAIETGNKT